MPSQVAVRPGFVPPTAVGWTTGGAKPATTSRELADGCADRLRFTARLTLATTACAWGESGAFEAGASWLIVTVRVCCHCEVVTPDELAAAATGRLMAEPTAVKPPTAIATAELARNFDILIRRTVVLAECEQRPRNTSTS